MIRSSNLKCKTIQTELIYNGKFFNAGVRKQTESFCLPYFVEIMIQSLLYSIDLKDGWILIGGDGRVNSNDLAMKVINVLAGNGIRKVVVALNGWLPSSAAAYLMRHQYCHFGLLFTGGHQPPGENGFLGLKLLSPPGIPIREEITDKANRMIRSLQSFTTCEKLTINLNQVGETERMISERKFSIEIVDPVTPYVEAMKEMFDFTVIKEFVQNYKMLISCSAGVIGTFVKKIFIDELGVPERRILNAMPLEDFGGWSPDPNSVTCRNFVSRLKEGEYEFGAVINPDGCRCMIVGEEEFIVSPSDSLAIVAAQSQCILCFQENKLETVVRTICTSQAMDRVAKDLSLLHFETPIGWQHFSGAMLPARGKAGLFGEECSALGISTDKFCGDRDGILTILAWLSILATTKKSVKAVVQEHWKTYGRSFFGRLDFENVPHQSLDSFLNFFREKNSLRFRKIKSGNFTAVVYLDPFGVDPNLQTEEAKRRNTEIVFDIENYVYPCGFIKKSLLKDEQYQIYQIHLMKDARLIIRRSESSSSSSILRFYIEYRVQPENEVLFDDREVVLKPFIKAAMKVTKLEDFFSSDVSPIFV